MKRICLVLALASAFAATSFSAGTIGGVCLNDSYTCQVYEQNYHYESIFGSGLPVDGNEVFVAVLPSSSCYPFNGCSIGIIRPYSPFQQYWYDSSTQINFDTLPFGYGGSTAYIEVCDQNTQVCTSSSPALSYLNE
ncbi:MAG TPA: hypothetical protein VH640_30750, partial [Bryobacteraceae bacterium]|jgi:hypothetical protein